MNQEALTPEAEIRLESDPQFAAWWQQQLNRPFINLKQSCYNAFTAGRTCFETQPISIAAE